ncbi:protein kinase domain protein [Ophiocordyceps sinensis CO18]|uniref:non-specific serine/threonine protein kinase n=1 Tax=Ophiocordyceps sinensis (strain Co18 / CGMCC 3.14243) TaxID=911162 RepID=T5AFE6_OPHSC|nr:protein kinase domain protein [Ophiocordyceps sinensis CO18]
MANVMDKPIEEERLDKPIEEELCGHRLKWYHPTRPGDVLDGRFKTICKLGFGGGSTIWLAENLKYIKIATLDINTTRETMISRVIAEADPSDEALSFIRTPIYELEVVGPEGTHPCLVYTPMRETLFKLRRRFRRQRLAPPLFKFVMHCVLSGLDYLHSKCRVIHTDIKDENIMVTIEREALLNSFARYQKSNPQPGHVRKEDGRTTYYSQGNFGPLRGSRLVPKLSDFDLAFNGGPAHMSPIQSNFFRAPEVMLGGSWSYSVDIWNLGLLMWDLLEDRTLCPERGQYDTHVHLAQLVTLLGEPPDELIKRERKYRKYIFREPISFTNSLGKSCNIMNEFWGGPFFDDNGNKSPK